ncbi:MAG: ectoine synthase [Spirochaetaceae bacterium]|nr:ectoine synthase [Spirochaetaceae bacterium]
MIIRNRESLRGTPQYVESGPWSSFRFFVKSDNMNFSLHDTLVKGGSEQTLWYKNHFEACIIIEGEAEIEDPATGKKFQLGPGSAYGLDKHDRHIFRAITDTRLICAFYPALSGNETHDADGSYRTGESH